MLRIVLFVLFYFLIQIVKEMCNYPLSVRDAWLYEVG